MSEKKGKDKEDGSADAPEILDINGKPLSKEREKIVVAEIEKRKNVIREAIWAKQEYAIAQELDRVATLGKENETLKVIAKELRLRLDKHLEKQATNIQCLKEQTDKKDEELDMLTENCKSLEANNAAQKKQNEKELEKADLDHLNMVMQLEAEMKQLRKDFDSLLDFINKRPHMQRRLQEYEDALEEENKEHALNIEKLEKRNIMEKDRLKNEMLRKIKETKYSLLAMTEDQLHSTTKRTILENEQMTIELQYQSKETERILKANQMLIKENRAIKRALGSHEHKQATLATRTRFYHKLIQKLQDQLSHPTQQKMQKKLETRLSRKKQKAIEGQLLDNTQLIQGLEHNVQQLEELVFRAQRDTESAQDALFTTRKRSESMIALQDEAYNFFMQCLADIDEKRMEAGSAAASEQGFDGVNETQVPETFVDSDMEEREKFLKLLVHKLSSAVGMRDLAKKQARQQQASNTDKNDTSPAKKRGVRGGS